MPGWTVYWPRPRFSNIVICGYCWKREFVRRDNLAASGRPFSGVGASVVLPSLNRLYWRRSGGTTFRPRTQTGYDRMSRRRPPGKTVWRCVLNRHRLALLIVLGISANGFVQAAAAQPASGSANQPCDPLIDGTYCATQGGRLNNGTASSPARMGSIQSLSGDLSLGQDQPATFGGISFSGSSVCFGLLRRENCN